MKRASEGNPPIDKSAAKAKRAAAVTSVPDVKAKRARSKAEATTEAKAEPLAIITPATLGADELARATTKTKAKRTTTGREPAAVPKAAPLAPPAFFELIAPLPVKAKPRKRTTKPLLEFIVPRPAEPALPAKLIGAATPPGDETKRSYSQSIHVEELRAAEPTLMVAKDATAQNGQPDGGATVVSRPEAHPPIPPSPKQDPIAKTSLPQAPIAHEPAAQSFVPDTAQPLGADEEPNLFSDEAQKARVVNSISRISEAEDEAAAFWSSPDAPIARSPAPSPSTERARITGAPSSSSAGYPARSGEDAHTGRRRRRRRRKGGQVQTEHPIDTPAMAAVVQKLRRQFGLHSFRPGQERIIRNVLAGQDTLAVMPTGSGKSLTFQLPAMVLEGVTVVVSPLLALMKDQTDKLRRRGVVAARLDSTLTKADERHTLQMIDEGQRKLIYVTPERAGSADFKSELSGQKVSLFVIDEAHCVSQWGHDFRPAYLNLKHALQELDNPPVLALTATATPRVVDDIKDRLDMPEAELVHTGFARPELAFDVRTVPDETAQIKRLLRLIRRMKGSGIVYCSTIASVEMLAKGLPRLGIRAGMYHGKMTKLERDSEQQRFMSNQNRVMIATNAFGLGVDKPDIRFVIHYNLPGSVEAYYQEAGRAGRDGKPARCILLWRSGDEEVQEHFVAQKYPGRDQVRQVAYALTTGPGKVIDIALRAGVPQKKTQVVLAMLEEGNLAKQIAGAIWTPVEEVADEQVVWNAAEAYRKKRESDRERLQAMLDYAETRRCRVQFLLEYFVEEVPPCGKCDNCTGRNTAVDDDEEEPEVAEPLRPRVETPALPPPPRKDPTTMF